MREDHGTHTEADAGRYERAHAPEPERDYPDLDPLDARRYTEPWRGWAQFDEPWVGA
jgi:hypothetical protein